MYRFTGKNSELKKIGYSILRKDGLSYSRKWEDAPFRHEAHMFLRGGMIIRFSSINSKFLTKVIDFILENKDKGEEFWGTSDERKAYVESKYIMTKEGTILKREDLFELGKKKILSKHPEMAGEDLKDFAEMAGDNMIELRFVPHLRKNIIQLDNISPLEKI